MAICVVATCEVPNAFGSFPADNFGFGRSCPVYHDTVCWEEVVAEEFIQ
jgi:hypothetical protein